MPVHIDCNFVVDATNANGITSLKGAYVKAVYMQTSTTPSAGNPDPANGTIVVQLSDNYNGLLSVSSNIVAPNSGSALAIDSTSAALTAGVAYVISTLGDATAARWHLLGVPAGITPAVGVAFIAASTGVGAGASTSRVMASAAAGSGVVSIEGLGQPNLLINPSPAANQGFGSEIILQCYDAASAKVAPAAGSIISLSFLLSNSSVLIGGQS